MISVQDMTDLLYIHDAYDNLNINLFGVELVIGYHEGNLGALNRIHTLIERNAAEELKKNDYKEVWEIAENTSITPEERARMLLMLEQHAIP